MSAHVFELMVCRMPRRVVQELPGQVLGIPLSLGSIQNSGEEASDAVVEPCAEPRFWFSYWVRC